MKMVDNTVYQIYYHKFPLAFRFGSYHALFRPMTIDHLTDHLYDISSLRDQTYQRLQSTRLLIKRLIEFGTDSPEGTQVIAHMNRAHEKVIADNDAYRYVLCCFFLEPFRWNQRYEKKRISAEDKQTIINFWNAIGEKMGIKELCSNEAAWMAFQKSYETQFLASSENGRRLAKQAIEETPKLAFPFGISYLVRQTLLATMDRPVRHALKLGSPTIPAALLLPALQPLNKFARR